MKLWQKQRPSHIRRQGAIRNLRRSRRRGRRDAPTSWSGLESLVPRMLPSAEFVGLVSDLGGFRFIADGQPGNITQDEISYTATIDHGEATDVIFRLGDQTVEARPSRRGGRSNTSPSTWQAVVDLSTVGTVTDELMVEVYEGNGLTDIHTQPVEMIEIPDWMKVDQVTYTGYFDRQAGYVFEISIDHFKTDFQTPDHWKLEALGTTGLDLGGKRTGIDVASMFTLSLPKLGGVPALEQAGRHVNAEILDLEILDEHFDYSAATTINTDFGDMSIGVSIEPSFDEALDFTSISGNVWVDADLESPEWLLGKAVIPLTGVPGIAAVLGRLRLD